MIFLTLQAAEHWELALGINPLHSDGWFSLGYCHLKTGNGRRAVQSFTRCTQQQPDNGDAWNNIAALNIQVSIWQIYTFICCIRTWSLLISIQTPVADDKTLEKRFCMTSLLFQSFCGNMQALMQGVSGSSASSTDTNHSCMRFFLDFHSNFPASLLSCTILSPYIKILPAIPIKQEGRYKECILCFQGGCQVQERQLADMVKLCSCCSEDRQLPSSCSCS